MKLQSSQLQFLLLHSHPYHLSTPCCQSHKRPTNKSPFIFKYHFESFAAIKTRASYSHTLGMLRMGISRTIKSSKVLNDDRAYSGNVFLWYFYCNILVFKGLLRQIKISRLLSVWSGCKTATFLFIFVSFLNSQWIVIFSYLVQYPNHNFTYFNILLRSTVNNVAYLFPRRQAFKTVFKSFFLPNYANFQHYNLLNLFNFRPIFFPANLSVLSNEI